MQQNTLIMDDKAMQRAIARISYEIIEHNKGVDNLCVIGILSRGVEIANRVAKKIFEVEGKVVPVGMLDITLFRDDREVKGHVDKSDITFPIKDKKVVLVDDVIYTGRSVRAAIDALMARGRPMRIELAVLVDRGHRELPIRADFVGKNLPTSRNEKVKVSVNQFDGEDKVEIIKED
ncbi:bifunctional pyr operon transcriptional regulator/uracil phosphoribosyltransferase PyrR [Paludicola sp. MB14-C6]|uniref:bifunctional pyr operon transcriptional regulator/uracil phosphoribosyltransferase PyrR n=1 Tax=Paludihabitans sp. MB14-C6 TaxID=3070656 RepID=UPI0027DBCF42|nr:bifunctional pyr operon transcriptional regulator/uracil phosphoribosyltransferase PyrR [Paludicola sp. MB14-C6]WMJ22412.1 bifunctional pyr operon transcriptional regulator/uracil phosphoribosyltransferase PyrR [Paludicola sp. MB14-C6]